MHVTLRFVAVVATMLSVPALRPAEAQAGENKSRAESKSGSGSEKEVRRLPGFSLYVGSEDQAVIGVTLDRAGRSDTLGVLIYEVTPDGPAAKAGVKAGDRVTAINGVNLRLAAVDADDPEVQSLGQRRLTRELGKAKPGDEVELRLAAAGQSRTVRVKTVSAADLSRKETRGTLLQWPDDQDKRAALGLSVGSSGNPRDTLGLFISSVVADGPADKAGIVEGERIAAINGVDVRVLKEDAGDAQAASARLNRFLRQLRKLAPGDKVGLRVYSAGRYRDVSATAGKASELNSGFHFNVGDGPMVFSMPRPMNGGSIPMPARPPQVFRFDGGANGGIVLDGQRLRVQGEALNKAMDELRLRIDGVRQRLNDGRIQTLNGGGMRIRTSPLLHTAPGQPLRVINRRVITTV